MKGFNAAGTWAPRGRGFSMGFVQPAGHIIHFTGQVAWDETESIVGLVDVAEQTRQCYRNIEIILAKVGGRLEDLISVTTYYLDQAHLPLIQQVRTEILASASPPTSTSIMVAGLGHPDFLVELSPIAVIPPERFIEPD